MNTEQFKNTLFDKLDDLRELVDERLNDNTSIGDDSQRIVILNAARVLDKAISGITGEDLL